MRKQNDDKQDKPNPSVKENKDGTVTLTYRQTEEQKRLEATEQKMTGGKK